MYYSGGKDDDRNIYLSKSTNKVHAEIRADTTKTQPLEISQNILKFALNKQKNLLL